MVRTAGSWGSPDRSLLVLTSLAGGPKHGYALIKDIEGFAAVRLGAGHFVRLPVEAGSRWSDRAPPRPGPPSPL